MGLFLSLCWVVFIFLFRSTPYPPLHSGSNQITKPIRTSTYLHTPGTRGVVFGGMMMGVRGAVEKHNYDHRPAISTTTTACPSSIFEG
uniref:Putative secreted protein n=1 Tax=Anopheles darlingi TaxID=43151 RepID=A0A2M4DJ75_ANODA